MATDTTRLTEGTLLNNAGTAPLPVGTLIRNSTTGLFGVSTSASVAAFTYLFGLTAGITPNEIADLFRAQIPMSFNAGAEEVYPGGPGLVVRIKRDLAGKPRGRYAETCRCYFISDSSPGMMKYEQKLKRGFTAASASGR